MELLQAFKFLRVGCATIGLVGAAGIGIVFGSLYKDIGFLYLCVGLFAGILGILYNIIELINIR